MINTKRTRIHKDRRGAAAVEFAFCAPLIFLVFLGMIECGRMMMVQHVVITATREGARASVIAGATNQSVEAIVEETLASVGVGDEEYNLNITPSVASAASGQTVNVSIGVPITAVTAFGGMWFGDDFQLSSAAAMRKEGFE